MIQFSKFLLVFVALVLYSGSAYAQTLAYVTNAGNADNVLVIDTASNTVIETIQVGEGPDGIAITPDGTRAYVANFSGTVSVIDTACKIVIDTINIERGLRSVAITPNGTKAYVTNSIAHKVHVIDIATNTLMGEVNDDSFMSFNQPFDIVITPDGLKGYVNNIDGFSISVINIISDVVVKKINVCATPLFLDITSDGSKVYYSCGLYSCGSLDEITTASDTVTNSIPMPDPGVPLSGSCNPRGVAITTDDMKAYVGTFSFTVSDNPDDLVVVDLINNMTAVIPGVGNNLKDVAITPDGSKLYIGTFIGDELIIALETATNTIEDTIPTDVPQQIAFGEMQLCPEPEISLSPPTATNEILTEDIVTATVLIDKEPEADVLVMFEIISGPNAGLVSTPNNGECKPNDCRTDINGEVSWTYTGSKFPGTDTIVASFEGDEMDILEGDEMDIIESNIIEKIWLLPPRNVPTLSEWGLVAMAAILGIVGFMVLKRRKATS